MYIDEEQEVAKITSSYKALDLGSHLVPAFFQRHLRSWRAGSLSAVSSP